MTSPYTPDDPNSVRGTKVDEIALLRRKLDHEHHERLVRLEAKLDEMDKLVRTELLAMDERVETKVRAREKTLVNDAASQAVKTAFGHLGVDVDNPEAMEAFRNDLRFGGVFRSAVQKSFFSLLAAIFGGIGFTLWLLFQNKLGLK